MGEDDWDDYVQENYENYQPIKLEIGIWRIRGSDEEQKDLLYQRRMVFSDANNYSCSFHVDGSYKVEHYIPRGRYTMCRPDGTSVARRSTSPRTYPNHNHGCVFTHPILIGDIEFDLCAAICARTLKAGSADCNEADRLYLVELG